MSVVKKKAAGQRRINPADDVEHEINRQRSATASLVLKYRRQQHSYGSHDQQCPVPEKLA